MFDQAPDAAIEIVSPQQSPNAVLRRCVWYVENGVAFALLVDPVDRSIVRFEQDHAARVLRAGDGIEFGAVLHGFRLTVDEVFGALRLP